MINYEFINWWGPGGSENFKYFFNDIFNLYNRKDVFVELYGPFGPLDNIKNNSTDAIKIYYTGENTKVYHTRYKNEKILEDKVDIILSFFEETSKNIRFPIWLWYHYYWKYGLLQSDKNIDRHSKSILLANNPANRYNLINYIKTNINITIDTNLNNCGNYIRCGETIEDKLNFIKQYKYNICPENSDSEGYTTEKLLHSIQAGCIPIYWPDRPVEPNIINNNKIIFIGNNLKEQYEKNHDINDIWMPDALYFIMMFYFKVWKRVYQLLIQKELLVSIKEPNENDKIIYTVSSLSEISNILKTHFKKYSNLFHPRIKINFINNKKKEYFLEELDFEY
jgi:hypothetical protein